MIKPPPYKAVCPQCGSSEIISPQSDCLSPLELPGMCPKCNIPREQERKANMLEIAIANVKNTFGMNPKKRL